ncbi:MAG: phosphatase PAP2 family protein [Thermomicrobiales bacterium]
MAASRFRDAWELNDRSHSSATRPQRAIVAGFVPLLLLYALYTLLRWTFVDRAASVGDHNAQSVITFQSRLGIDWEQPIQAQVLGRSESVWLVNHYYVYAFFPVLIGSAVLAAWRAPAVFHEWRKIFVVSLSLALAGFALYPLTPPRLLGGQTGYVDTLLLSGPRYYGDESGSSLFNLYGSIPSIVNEYAAMPSMHVGWSAVAAALLIAAFPERLLVKVLAVAHVIVMQLVVVATGNHFFIDGIIGLLVVLVSWLVVVRFLPRLESWWELGRRSHENFTVCQK